MHLTAINWMNIDSIFHHVYVGVAILIINGRFWIETLDHIYSTILFALTTLHRWVLRNHSLWVLEISKCTTPGNISCFLPMLPNPKAWHQSGYVVILLLTHSSLIFLALSYSLIHVYPDTLSSWCKRSHAVLKHWNETFSA